MPRKSDTMDRLADMLAEDMTLSEAAVKLGTSYSYANAVFQRMKAKLGRQAR